ncbi:Programmed cell death antitoxin YdcD [Olavius algarvensis Delta 1 endosymbiont]|nr:Programmed cell death antitoxin YdcD [Olavius algarvensis Delta 1 endosymbiont]
MKTAISLPDEIYHSADQLAKRLGMSRSELYSKAVALYISAHKNEAVTEALNKIYAKEKSELDPAINMMQLKSLPREEW